MVLVELAGGDVLEVCHVIGAAPRWIALAAVDRGASASEEVETVLIPYEQITKVRIRGRRPDDVVGFDTNRSPTLLDPGSSASLASSDAKPVPGRRRGRTRG